MKLFWWKARIRKVFLGLQSRLMVIVRSSSFDCCVDHLSSRWFWDVPTISGDSVSAIAVTASATWLTVVFFLKWQCFQPHFCNSLGSFLRGEIDNGCECNFIVLVSIEAHNSSTHTSIFVVLTSSLTAICSAMVVYIRILKSSILRIYALKTLKAIELSPAFFDSASVLVKFSFSNAVVRIHHWYFSIQPQ